MKKILSFLLLGLFVWPWAMFGQSTGDFTLNRDAVTDFPWTENFESHTASTNTGSSGVTFSAPDWVNQHISGSGNYLFQVCSRTNGNNNTHQLVLPDMVNNTYTKLALPIMQFEAGRNYQFSLDVYRTYYSPSYTTEGIRIYASTDGEIEGATELAFIPREYSAQSTSGTTTIPAEATANSWYNYKLSIPSGTTRIILRGESKYGAATFMDNFKVKALAS